LAKSPEVDVSYCGSVDGRIGRMGDGDVVLPVGNIVLVNFITGKDLTMLSEQYIIVTMPVAIFKTGRMSGFNLG
jgi:hypothetical protein